MRPGFARRRTFEFWPGRTRLLRARLLEVRVELVHVRIRQRLAELRRKLLVPFQDGALVGDPLLNIATHVLAGVELRFLRKQAGAVALRDARVADVFLVDAGHDAKQCRFARAVRAEHADLRRRVEGQRDAFQDLPLGAGRDLLESVHRVDELRRHVRTVSAADRIRFRSERWGGR